MSRGVMVQEDASTLEPSGYKHQKVVASTEARIEYGVDRAARPRLEKDRADRTCDPQGASEVIPRAAREHARRDVDGSDVRQPCGSQPAEDEGAADRLTVHRRRQGDCGEDWAGAVTPHD
ncbi:MAG: hypothetical protein JO004_02440 [Methylobacteriaceae bacterium]|nr:hypothetical protein [Methylobacteriaceae bacterium]